MSSKKQMMDIDKTNAMSVALSDEHQRKWDEQQWKNKMDDPERNYDSSRRHLNFEIKKDRKIIPIDTSKRINERVEERLQAWKQEQLLLHNKQVVVRTTQHKSVNIVYGGNRERMLEMAFGNQKIQGKGMNGQLKRQPEIEQWALDIYDYSCREFGADNIVSFIVHCDETNPHAHCVVTPITPDGRLSAKSMFGGNSKQEAAAHLRQIHDRLSEVNEKWGLDRGDDIHVTGAVHKTLREHNRDLHRENLSLEEEIKRKQTKVKGLMTMIQNLENREKEITEQLSELQNLLNYKNTDKELISNRIKESIKELDEVRYKLSDKKLKLMTANNELENLNEAIDRGNFCNKELDSSNKRMANILEHNINNILKSSVFYDVINPIVNFCRENPQIGDLFEDTLIDDFNFLRGNDVLHDAAVMFFAGIDGATNIAPGSVGGGNNDDRPWRDKDESEMEYARRCVLWAHHKHSPKRRSARGAKR